MWKVEFAGNTKTRRYKNRYTLIDGVYKIIKKDGIAKHLTLNHYQEDGKIKFVATHVAGMIGVDILLATAELVM